jgi:hypothetical protein
MKSRYIKVNDKKWRKKMKNKNAAGIFYINEWILVLIKI